MGNTDKTTENSKVELSDDELDSVQGGYTAADKSHKGGTPERVGVISKETGSKNWDWADLKGETFQDGSDLLIGKSRMTKDR